MDVACAESVRDLLSDTVGDHLRAVIAYDETGYEGVFLRADLHDEYDADAVEYFMQASRLEAFERPVIADKFADDHGALVCQATCFEHVAKVNIALSETDGVVIALDRDAFQTGPSLLGEVRAVAEREHTDEQSGGSKSECRPTR